MRHVLVTGTGRAGSTVLMRVLTDAGAGTGFASGDPRARSANSVPEYLERHLVHDGDLLPTRGLPRWLKHPAYSVQLRTIAAGLDVERIVVPLRSAEDVVASRLRSGRLWLPTRESPLRAPTLGEFRRDHRRTNPATEQAKSVELVGRILAEDAAALGVPITYVVFPRFVRDYAYFREKVEPLLAPHVLRRLFVSYSRHVDPKRG